MIKQLLTLFKLGRKLAKSDILNVVSKFKKPPLAIKILFQILSFSFSNPKKINLDVTEGERLSKSLQSMGTTFKMSDLANFLPNLNNVNSFLIIIFSNQSGLLQFRQISFSNYNFQIYLFSLDQLILLD